MEHLTNINSIINVQLMYDEKKTAIAKATEKPQMKNRPQVIVFYLLIKLHKMVTSPHNQTHTRTSHLYVRSASISKGIHIPNNIVC